MVHCVRKGIKLYLIIAAASQFECMGISQNILGCIPSFLNEEKCSNL